MRSKPSLLTILISITLVSLPLYVVRCSSFSFCIPPLPFTLLEFLILLTFFVWLLTKIKESHFFEIISEIRDKLPLLYQILIFSFLFSALVATLTSTNFIGALGHYRAFFIEPLLLFIVIYDYLTVTKNFKLVLWSLFVSGLWLSLLALTEKTFGFNPGNPVEFLQRGRVSAVYTSSNAIGLYLGPITAVSFGYWAFLAKGKLAEFVKTTEARLLLVSFVIFLGGHYSSGSRGGYLGLLLVFMFYFFYFLFNKLASRFRKRLITTLITSIFIVFLGIFIVLFNTTALLNNNFVTENFSGLRPRLCIWEGTTNLVQDKPILGSGLRGFREDYPNYQTCNSETAIYPHNIFLNFWTETGLFGLLSFLLLVVVLVRALLTKKPLDFLSLALVGYFVYLLVHGLFDVPYFNNDLSAQFWVFLALAVYKIRES